MRNTINKTICAILCIILGLLALASCDLNFNLGSSSDDLGTEPVKVKSAECDGEKITVIYEDGYTVELTVKELISYERVMTVIDNSESDEDGKNDVEGDENEVPAETEIGEADDGISYGSIVADSSNVTVETMENGDVKYYYGNVSGSGDAFVSGGMTMIQFGNTYGVRVLGTDRNPVGGSEGVLNGVVINGSVVSGSFATDSSIAGTVFQQFSGYESYESHISEYIAELFTEIVIAGEIDTLSNSIIKQEAGFDGVPEDGEKNDGSALIGTATVDRIISGGFSGLTKLSKITVPNTIKTIENAAFYNCAALTEIIFEGTVEEWNAIDKQTDWDKNTGEYIVRCTDGNINKGE